MEAISEKGIYRKNCSMRQGIIKDGIIGNSYTGKQVKLWEKGRINDETKSLRGKV